MNINYLLLKRIINTAFCLLLCAAVCIGAAACSGIKIEPSDGTVNTVFLNVGKADASVSVHGSSVTIIDTGTEDSSYVIKNFLDSYGIKQIDRLFITHFDKDHVGGAADIIQNYDVKNIYTTWYEAKESEYIDAYHRACESKNITPVLVKEELTLEDGGAVWKVYPPLSDKYEKKTSNNSSLVIKLSYGEQSVLFCGDAQEERIDELLSTPGLESQMIKMPHHGKYESNLDALIKYVKPVRAVLTSGNEADDLEDEETLEVLRENSVSAFFTRKGDVYYAIDSEGSRLDTIMN